MPTTRARVSNGLNAVLQRVDLRLVRASELEVVLNEAGRKHRNQRSNSAIPPGAAEYLRFDHPRLVELRERYRQHPAAFHSQWTEDYVKRELDLRYFRGDNAYLYQQTVASEAKYILAAYYLKSIDHLNLFARLSDDELFGNYLLEWRNGAVLSRDLMDSISEILFLDRQLSLSKNKINNILDIGAGYGRLAHRLVQVFPSIDAVYCVDAVAESTFLSEYYLAFRGVADRAIVIPVDELDARTDACHIELASNVFSFSECTLKSIEGWLDFLVRRNVRYLFIVDKELLTTEVDGSRKEFLSAIHARGYGLLRSEAKYLDPLTEKYAAFACNYYLFERQTR